MPLSGDEVAQCLLEGCQLVLKSSPLGLSLHWLVTDDGKRKLHGTSCLSSVQHGGSLYPIFMDSPTEKAVFKYEINDSSCNASKRLPQTALVVSDSRTVLAAHCKLPGQCVTLCHMIQPILWTGILKVGDVSVIVVVSKGTAVSFGRSESLYNSSNDEMPYQDSLVWHMKSLPAAPVTCCGQQNMLLFSDGTMSWLCLVSLSEEGEVILKCSKLYVKGIIKINDEKKIHMFSCDGRKYMCTWDTLSGQNENMCWKPGDKVKVTEQPHTISEMMKAIEKCSKIINMEGKTIQTLGLYLKQLSLAQRLLTEQKCIFSPTIKVEKSVESKDYLATVKLSKINADIDLRGRWWALCMVIDGIKSKSVSSMKLREEQLKSDIYQTIVLPPLDFSTTSGHIEVESYLVLQHFSSSQPVCRVLACQIKIDILDFLSTECNLSLSPECNFSTTAKLLEFGATKCIDTKITSHLGSESKRDPFPFCKVSLSFVNTNNTLGLLHKLFNFESRNSETRASTQTTLWYKDNRIEVTCAEEDKNICIKLESPNSSIVLSLKTALERRIEDLKEQTVSVTLGSSVLKEAHLTHRLLNYEGNRATTVTAVSHLYHAISLLSALLPHG